MIKLIFPSKYCTSASWDIRKKNKAVQKALSIYKLSILSVHDYPSAKQFVERVKKSQCESYEVASCGTFRTEAFSFTLIPEAKEDWRQHMSQHDCSTVRTFTDCDDTHECPSN